MELNKVSSEAFVQNVRQAMQMADERPLLITDQGCPSHVLLSWADYRRLVGRKRDLAAILSMPGLSDIDLETERPREFAREVDFD